MCPPRGWAGPTLPGWATLGRAPPSGPWFPQPGSNRVAPLLGQAPPACASTAETLARHCSCSLPAACDLGLRAPWLLSPGQTLVPQLKLRKGCGLKDVADCLKLPYVVASAPQAGTSWTLSPEGHRLLSLTRSPNMLSPAVPPHRCPHWMSQPGYRPQTDDHQRAPKLLSGKACWTPSLRPHTGSGAGGSPYTAHPHSPPVTESCPF